MISGQRLYNNGYEVNWGLAGKVEAVVAGEAGPFDVIPQIHSALQLGCGSVRVAPSVAHAAAARARTLGGADGQHPTVSIAANELCGWPAQSALMRVHLAFVALWADELAIPYRIGAENPKDEPNVTAIVGLAHKAGLLANVLVNETALTEGEVRQAVREVEQAGADAVTVECAADAALPTVLLRSLAASSQRYLRASLTGAATTEQVERVLGLGADAVAVSCNALADVLLVERAYGLAWA